MILLAYLVVIVLGTYAGEMVVQQLNVDLRPATEAILNRMIVASLVVYVLLMAVPFVPSVEIGLALILLLGADIVPVVYLSTVLALLLAFTIGRLVPETWLQAGFARVGLTRAAGLIERLRPLDVEARIIYLVTGAPGRPTAWLLRHRCWAVAALLNIPGNTFVGGGGGIALMAGMTRLVSFPAFVLTVALGIAPLPAAILLLDALR